MIQVSVRVSLLYVQVPPNRMLLVMYSNPSGMYSSIITPVKSSLALLVMEMNMGIGWVLAQLVTPLKVYFSIEKSTGPPIVICVSTVWLSMVADMLVVPFRSPAVNVVVLVPWVVVLVVGLIVPRLIMSSGV